MDADDIPPYRYAFDRDDADAIADEIRSLILSGDHLTMGAHGAALERALVSRHGHGHALAVANGTSALEVALRALGIDSGEVITPTNTFGATIVPILRVGARPVLVDCGDDLSISSAAVEARLSTRTRAVVVVHIGGHVAEATRRLVELCRRAEVSLIEDVAHAMGALLGVREAGAFGDIAAFSLFSTKVITSGEGGLLFTADEALQARAATLRDHAKLPDGTMTTTGYNWRLSEFQAVVARRQLAALDAIIDDRSRVARLYNERIEGVPRVRPMPVVPGARPNWYKYVVFTDGVDPDELAARMHDAHGVHLGGWVYRTPCHAQPAFAAYADDWYPNADRLCRSHVCLPVYPGMTEGEVDRVVEAMTTEIRAMAVTP